MTELEKLVKEWEEDDRARLRGPRHLPWALLLALGRPATEKEAGVLARYAARHGMANACRVILNANEFIFVP